MKVLVLGGDGQVARAVVATAPAGHTLIVKTRAELDVADSVALAAAVAASGAEWLVNGAAYTAVDRAETEPDAARAVNETAVGVMARTARQCGCRTLHISTDFVFDGRANGAYRPGDATNPLSVYGATKLGGERLLLEYDPSAVLVRTAWVYASRGRNFVLTMLRLMREKSEVCVVADQIGAPTWATGLAGAIWGFIDGAAAGGTYHWTDLGVASWYDFAVAVQDEALALGLLQRAVPVLPIRTEAYPTPARRPAFSVLDTDSGRLASGAPARHWRHNLRMMLNELRSA